MIKETRETLTDILALNEAIRDLENEVHGLIVRDLEEEDVQLETASMRLHELRMDRRELKDKLRAEGNVRDLDTEERAVIASSLFVDREINTGASYSFKREELTERVWAGA